MPRSYGTTNAAPYATAPPVGAAGDTYFNTTSKTMFLSDGTQWIQVQGATAGTPNYLYGVCNYGSANLVSGTNTSLTWSSILATGITVSGANITFSTTGKYSVEFNIGLYASSAAISRVDAYIDHRSSGGVQKAYRRIMGNYAAAAGGQFTLLADAILDVVAGDYVFVQVNPTGNGCQVDWGGQYSWVEIMPVAAAGPAGAAGAAGTSLNVKGSVPAQANLPASGNTINDTYTDTNTGHLWTWNGSTWVDMGPVVAGTAAGYVCLFATGPASLPQAAWATLTWGAAAPPASFINGFTLQAASQQIACTVAGRYRVNLQVGVTAGTSGTNYVAAQILQYNSVGTLITSHSFNGTGTVTTGMAASGVHEMQVNMAVGDYLVAQGNVSLVATLDTRTTISISPVGGAKGDPGTPGAAGSAVAVPPPYLNVRKNVGLAVSASVWTQVTMDTQIDTNTAGDYTFSGGGSITVVNAGYYQITGVAFCPATGAAAIGIALWSGSAWNLLARAEASSGLLANVFYEGWLAAGAQIALMVFGNAAVTWAANTAPTTSMPYYPTLYISRMGGATGTPGAAGATGAQGPAGSTTQALTARGEWTAAAAYNPLEVVTRNGVAFMAMSANTNVDPGSLPAGSFIAASDLLAQVQSIGKVIPWTPVWRQGATVIPLTNQLAVYSRMGEWVVVAIMTSFNGAGAAATLTLDLPVPMRAHNGVNHLPGAAFIYNGANNYGMWATAGATTTIALALGSNYYSTAIATGHSVSGVFWYLAPVGV